jgi:hypothetical protein
LVVQLVVRVLQLVMALVLQLVMARVLQLVMALVLQLVMVNKSPVGVAVLVDLVVQLVALVMRVLQLVLVLVMALVLQSLLVMLSQHHLRILCLCTSGDTLQAEDTILSRFLQRSAPQRAMQSCWTMSGSCGRNVPS